MSKNIFFKKKEKKMKRFLILITVILISVNISVYSIPKPKNNNIGALVGKIYQEFDKDWEGKGGTLAQGKYYYGEVTIVNKSNNKKLTALTDLKGFYNFLNVEPGDYELIEFNLNANNGNANFTMRTMLKIGIKVLAGKISTLKTLRLYSEVLPAPAGQTDTVRTTPIKVKYYKEENFDDLKEYFNKIDNLKTWKDFEWEKEPENTKVASSSSIKQNTSSEQENIQTNKKDSFKEIAYDDGVSDNGVSIWGSIKNVAVGVLFTLPDKPIKIKGVKVFITNAGTFNTPFKIRLMDVNGDLTPGKDLLQTEVIASAMTENEWVTVDLSKYNIEVNQKNIFAAVQWTVAPGEKGRDAQFVGFSIRDSKSRGWLNFSGKPGDWIHKDTPGSGKGNFLIRLLY
jgi:hypothetical protein